MKYLSLHGILHVLWAGAAVMALGIPFEAIGKVNPKTTRKYEMFGHRLHADAEYHIFAYSKSGDVVQLHDSSKWEIHSHDQAKVKEWRKSQTVFLKPAYSSFWPSMFITYNYVLYNKSLNEVAGARLILAPPPEGVNTFTVADTDPYHKIVQLNDGTNWQMDPDDSGFSEWKKGNRVLVGVNNQWHTDPYPHILINADLSGRPYCKATYYPYGR